MVPGCAEIEDEVSIGFVARVKVDDRVRSSYPKYVKPDR
jgi:hypothetical protein